jgi:hypothetical protein
MRFASGSGVVAGAGGRGRSSWCRSSGFSERTVGLIALAFFVQFTTGCLSNEYRIPSDELQRLAQTPPEIRGHHVHIVQSLGDRRSDAIPYRAPPPPPPEMPPPAPDQPPPPPDGTGWAPDQGDGPVGDDEWGDDGSGQIDINIDGSGSGAGPRHVHHGPSPRGRFGGDGVRGNPPSGWRGSPPGGGHGGSVAHGGGHGGGGGGGVHIGGGGSGSGGGGGGGGEALLVIAVVLAVVAVVAGVSLVASEGMRFDGYAELAPEQTIHLKGEYVGSSHDVALADLTPQDARMAVEATVKDDEDFGLGIGDRAPLDRRGLAFKVEMGSSDFNLGLQEVAGMASQIQIGGFFTRSAGVMLDIGLSGGSLCCSSLFQRHSLALEAQVFPWSLGPLWVGAFAKGGAAIANDSVSTQTGPMFGGGALVEIALTTRLALSFRAGANAAHFDGGWSTAGTLTGGISIY